MSAQHTPGRLVVRGGYSIYTAGLTPVADTCITNSETANAEANARRLAACWNACDGMETDLLENIVLTGDTLVGRFTAREIAHEIKERELRSQNADMLAALIVAREFISTKRNSFAKRAMSWDGTLSKSEATFVAEYDAALLQIDAAIQKATPATPTQPAKP